MSLVSPIVFSLLAAGLTIVAVRGRWLVFRSVVGAVGFLFAMIAVGAWLSFAWLARAGRGSATDTDTAVYVGWDPRAFWGSRGLLLAALFAGYMALVLWAGHRRRQKKLQGKN